MQRDGAVVATVLDGVAIVVSGTGIVVTGIGIVGSGEHVPYSGWVPGPQSMVALSDVPETAEIEVVLWERGAVDVEAQALKTSTPSAAAANV